MVRALALLGCWTAPLLSGQALQISSTVSADRIRIEVAMDAPPGKAPVALQWETAFPAQQLVIQGAGPVAGKAAINSGKALTCAGRWKKAPQVYSYMCILAGVQKPISNGPIAVISFKASASPPSGRAEVRLDHIQGVTADLKKITLGDAATTVVIGPVK